MQKHLDSIWAWKLMGPSPLRGLPSLIEPANTHERLIMESFSARRKGRGAMKIVLVAILGTIACALWSFLPANSYAQQIPRRVEQLQTYRGQITPPPLSQADSLRDDIINATQPNTGAVDVRVLQRPDVARPPWPGKPVSPGTAQAVPRPDISRPPWPGSGTGGR